MNQSTNLRELFDAAVAIAPAQRAAFLARHCVDAQHRAALERLLDADEDVSARMLDQPLDAMLERTGVERRVRLVVPHFIAVGHILHSTDMIATVPERFAAGCAEPFDLVALPHPANLPEIAINLFWHERYHRDPASRWLRERLVELFAETADA